MKNSDIINLVEFNVVNDSLSKGNGGSYPIASRWYEGNESWVIILSI